MGGKPRTSERIPRKVFRVLHKDGTPFVAERTLVAHNGSWVTTERPDGTQEKENGNYWSDTVLEAIQREAEHIVRFGVVPLLNCDKQVRQMDALIREAMEWGRMVGMVGMATKNKPDTHGPTRLSYWHVTFPTGERVRAYVMDTIPNGQSLLVRFKFLDNGKISGASLLINDWLAGSPVLDDDQTTPLKGG